MTNDTRSPDEIERDIADERAQMSETFDDLQKKFSVETIITDLGGMLRGQGGDIGRSVSATLGRNPAAVAMVGVGLAWLLLGQNGASDGDKKRNGGHRGRSASDPWANADRLSDRTSAADDRFWYEDGQRVGESHDSGFAADRWAQNATASAQGKTGVAGSLRDAAVSVGQTVSDAMGNVAETASGITDRLSHGLEHLSEEARSRVLAARQSAHKARQASEAALSRATRAASSVFEDQPLVIGALAVALGAALGGVLPHTKIEDDTMGNSSDLLFAEAQALFRTETDKAMAALKAAATDAQSEIRAMGTDLADLLPDGKSVGQVIVDRTSDAAVRVVERAIGDLAPPKAPV